MLLLAYLILMPILCSSQSLDEVIFDIALAAKELFINENTPCIADLETFFLDLVRGRPWSLRSKLCFFFFFWLYFCKIFFLVLDASSKLNPGLLVGNTYHFGNYDECLNLVQKNEKHKVNITGKYCGIKIVLKNNRVSG